MNKTYFIITLLVTSFSAIALDTESSELLPKVASSYTKKSNEEIKSYLPFDDKADFENAQKGFIGTIDSGVIYQGNKAVSYNMQEFDFLNQESPDTANPSLWRQGQLNRINGLFKVQDDIYQVRSFDLSNMTLIKGKTGWIVIDPLITPDTAKAGMQLVEKHLGKFPVTAVIISHSHMDHFGGIRGIVDEADVRSGKVPIIAPKDFYQSAISENIMAGNAMARRASYMFGNLLPKNGTGMIGSGLGQTTSVGLPGILKHTDTISSFEGESRTVDGVEIEFIYTPESEAPAEMMFYFPKMKAFCQAENINRTFHNLYTLRGAKVRNGQKWAQYIDLAIQKWGSEVETSFGSHHWPTWENKNIVEFWENQRDLYRFIHDQTIRLANKGFTPKEIAEQLKLPESLDKQFYNRGYYGSVSHNIKAQYQLYYGWFDGNPANLNPLPPTEVGHKYVELAGGAEALLQKAKDSFDKGEYRWVAELLNHLVFSQPHNKAAKHLLADTYEQMGYAAESGPWRNFYLTGARELRHGVKVLPAPNGLTPDMIDGLSTDLLFNYIAMKFKGTDVDAAKMQYNFNIRLPDANEKIALIINNGVVNPRFNYEIKNDVTATITVNRKDLNRMSLGQVKFAELLSSQAMKIEGSQQDFIAFFSKVDDFEFWFNIVQP